jgi:ribosome silencing factor RsfS/YbeB/iojap
MNAYIDSVMPDSPGNQTKEIPIARKALSKRQAPSPAAGLLALVQRSLDDDKAEDVAVIDMAGKSAIADFMVIATGRSNRHVASMADHLRERLKPEIGHAPPIEGMTRADWVLVDAGDVVVHLFRPEVRTFYNLEKMWSHPLPEQDDVMAGLVKEKPAKPAPKKKAAAKAPVGKTAVGKTAAGKTAAGKTTTRKKKPAPGARPTAARRRVAS